MMVLHLRRLVSRHMAFSDEAELEDFTSAAFFARKRFAFELDD